MSSGAQARKTRETPPLRVVEEKELEQRIGHLRAVSLFTEIASNHDALHDFASVMEERIYPAGTEILTEGTQSSEMFLLIQGSASVFKLTPEKDKFRVAILKGDNHAFFGEGGLIHSEVKTATITSDVECHCLVLSREAFEGFGDRHPEWALPFYRRVSASVLHRLRKANDDMLVLYRALVNEIRGR